MEHINWSISHLQSLILFLSYEIKLKKYIRYFVRISISCTLLFHLWYSMPMWWKMYTKDGWYVTFCNVTVLMLFRKFDKYSIIVSFFKKKSASRLIVRWDFERCMYKCLLNYKKQTNEKIILYFHEFNKKCYQKYMSIFKLFENWAYFYYHNRFICKCYEEI